MTITNNDMLTAMSITERAIFLAMLDPRHCENCPAHKICRGNTEKMRCADYIEEWLRRPIQEEQNA